MLASESSRSAQGMTDLGRVKGTLPSSLEWRFWHPAVGRFGGSEEMVA